MSGRSKKEWDDSYRNKDNFVFYPHEEIIRFTARYLRKRTGISSYADQRGLDNEHAPPRVLDLGCGIGRHVVFLADLGIDAHGIELSDEAVSVARQWIAKRDISEPEQRVRQGDITQVLPWNRGHFDAVVSHGVLDSMPYDDALVAVKQVHRVLRKQGLFYCDLMSGDDSSHAREFVGEEVVAGLHECGTIQSYFNFEKVRMLFGTSERLSKDNLQHWSMESAHCIKSTDVINGSFHSRWHLVLRKV